MTVGGVGGSSGLASNQLTFPVDMALDSSNSLYIADLVNNRIQKWMVDAPNGTTVAGQVTGAGGITAAYFYGPYGIYVDSSYNIYVSDTNNHRVQFWANGASTGTTIAGTGMRYFRQ
jgi:sugar lactone lactonase YvrE